jgi:Peptidase A4 family
MTHPAVRWAAALTSALAVGLGGAATASADTTASSNWAGYAIHHSGLRFRHVVGSWTQPTATCTGGRATYSSVWVGIGGYSVTSPALEQIGTELDCTATGRAVSDAWYELVPAASHTTSLIVRPGDRMQASVAVTGNQVKLQINDLTRRRSFTKTLHATVLDTTSAEWIVEAPSACTTASDCQTLPLANFGSAAVTGARVTTTAGYRGSIADGHWATTKITLAEDARRFVRSPASRPILAQPSALTASGTGFTVSYTGTTASASAHTAATSATARAAATARAPAAGLTTHRLVHLGR